VPSGHWSAGSASRREPVLRAVRAGLGWGELTAKAPRWHMVGTSGGQELDRDLLTGLYGPTAGGSCIDGAGTWPRCTCPAGSSGWGGEPGTFRSMASLVEQHRPWLGWATRGRCAGRGGAGPRRRASSPNCRRARHAGGGAGLHRLRAGQAPRRTQPGAGILRNRSC